MIVGVTNEGGVQGGIDLGDIIVRLSVLNSRLKVLARLTWRGVRCVVGR